MPTTLEFRDHEVFHRAAADMVVFGALAGLAAHVGSLIHAPIGGLTAPVPLALLAGAAALGSTPAAERAGVGVLLRLALVVAAGIGVLVAGRAIGVEDSLSGVLFAATIATFFARGQEGHRRAIVVGAGIAALFGAAYVAGVFAGLPSLPAWASAGLAGAGFALVASLALVARHIHLARDRVGEAWSALETKIHGEMHELLERGHGVWRRVETSLETDSNVRQAIEESVLRLFEMGKRWQSVEADAVGASGGPLDLKAADKLVERMEVLDGKIRQTGDAIARGQYEQARAALAEQLRYVQQIATSRERVIARMHHYLAAMERLRFAVLNHKSADASRLSSEVQPILNDLKHLGQDIDFGSEALGEVEKEEERAAAEAGPN